MYLVEFLPTRSPAWTRPGTRCIPSSASRRARVLAAGAAQGLDIGQSGELVALLLAAAGRSQSRHQGRHAGPGQYLTGAVQQLGASLGEDLAVFGGLWAALNHPGCSSCCCLCFFWCRLALPKIWRAIKRLAGMFDAGSDARRKTVADKEMASPGGGVPQKTGLSALDDAK